MFVKDLLLYIKLPLTEEEEMEEVEAKSSSYIYESVVINVMSHVDLVILICDKNYL